MKASEELVSISKLREEIRAMKVLGIFLPRDKKVEIKRIENGLNEMIVQFDLFNARFTDSGWCAYEHMNFELIKSANSAYDCGGIDAAESVLLAYYKTDIKMMTHWLRHNPPELSIRYHLIEKLLMNICAKTIQQVFRYFLIIIDGAVNDFTSRRGFFADRTDVTAWDCLVGCSNGLTKLKTIFNKGRNITTIEAITMPYRKISCMAVT